MFGGLVHNYWKESRQQHDTKVPSHYIFRHSQFPIKVSIDKLLNIILVFLSSQNLYLDLLRLSCRGVKMLRSPPFPSKVYPLPSSESSR